jgi:hypothetical protein
LINRLMPVLSPECRNFKTIVLSVIHSKTAK